MRGSRLNRNIRGNRFTQRVVGIRNKLPEEVIELGTITTFNRHFDRRKVSRNMGHRLVNRTSSNGTWSAWMSWVEEPVPILYVSMTMSLTSGNLFQPNVKTRTIHSDQKQFTHVLST